MACIAPISCSGFVDHGAGALVYLGRSQRINHGIKPDPSVRKLNRQLGLLLVRAGFCRTVQWDVACEPPR